MYTVYADDLLLYHPLQVNDGFDISNPSLTIEENRSGSFTFKLLPTNRLYNHLLKLKTIITVYDDGEEIFRGRILDDEKDFYNCKSIYCEGQLSFLLDSIMRPYYLEEITPAEYFNQLITNHNNQVEEVKQFKPGNVTVEYADELTYFENTEYSNTWDELNQQLIDIYGGRLVVRIEDDGRYLDYLAENTEVSKQIIEFGVNMIDITQYITAVDVVTCLIPLGAMDDNYNRLTIESVTNGKDYIENVAGVATFGKITKVCIFEDITDPVELLEEARKYLESNIKMSVSLTVKAIDLHLLNVDTKRIKAGDLLRVLSRAHGLDSNFKCSKVVLKLQNPENNEYSLGLSYSTLTEKQTTVNKNVSQTQGQIISIKEQNDKNGSVISGLENTVNNMDVNVSDLNTRMSVAEQKITADAITTTVRSHKSYQNDMDSKVGTTEVISSINQTAEQVKISAEKIDLIGKVTAECLDVDKLSSITADLGIVSAGIISGLSGYIGGFTLDEYLSAEGTATYDFTQDDLTTIMNIIMSELPATEEQLKRYDTDGDGRITSRDYIRIQKIIAAGNSMPVRFIIDPTFEGDSTDEGPFVIEVGEEGLIKVTRTGDLYSRTLSGYRLWINDNAEVGNNLTVKNNLVANHYRRNSVTLNSWNSMGLVRGDSSNIIIYLNGIYVGEPGATLSIDGNVVIKTSATGNNITLNSPQADQYSWGVKIHSTTSGYGSLGTCVFTSTFTIS